MEETKKNKKKRFIVIAVIFALFAFVGVGYAYLAQALNITGTAKIDSDFKVEFQTATETTGADLGDVALSSSGDGGLQDTVTITVTLAKPGDSYVATIPVKNTGKIKAKYISLVPGEGNTQATGDVVLSFVADVSVTPNAELAVGATHNFTFTFKWTNTEAEQQVPTTTTYTFTYTLNYQQA